MNLWDVVLLAAVALAAVLAGRKLIRDRKHGGCACCGDCASCGRGCVTGASGGRDTPPARRNPRG